MKDIFAFESPLDILGKLASAVFLTTYMEQLLRKRNQVIKFIAESEQWKTMPGIK